MKDSKLSISVIIAPLLLSICCPFSGWGAEDLAQSEIVAAMKKAASFMMDTVSYRGGFVWTYRSDLAEQWGEIPARRSQIWVQPPGTTSVGMLMLDLYELTGDTDYLRFAERIAGALIYGQHPLGGWNYFIDFEPKGIREYYETVAAQCWGWEEYDHYDGNCTFDDEVHTSATRSIGFLLTEHCILSSSLSFPTAPGRNASRSKMITPLFILLTMASSPGISASSSRRRRHWEIPNMKLRPGGGWTSYYFPNCRLLKLDGLFNMTMR